MTIILNHTIVPARDKVAAARFLAAIFGLDFNEQSDHFAPVRVNETLTLLFNEDTSFDSHHYAFHVTHSTDSQDQSDWEPLLDHLRAVARTAGAHAAKFGCPYSKLRIAEKPRDFCVAAIPSWA